MRDITNLVSTPNTVKKDKVLSNIVKAKEYIMTYGYERASNQASSVII